MECAEPGRDELVVDRVVDLAVDAAAGVGDFVGIRSREFVDP